MQHGSYRIALLGTLFLAVAGCAQKTTPTESTGASLGRTEVTIMTFNVENLFDTEDDPGKDDRTYLPLEMKQTAEHRAACAQVEVPRWRDQCLNWDWSEGILERKLQVVAAAILQVDDGQGPDIVALQEVENLDVLERLRTQYLADAGYLPSILIEGDDNRGIDVGFLSRLELAERPELHRIPFGADPQRVADTRGILEATFVLPDGSLLTGYAVHFPAPFHPTDMRIAAYRFLAGLRASLPADRPAFAAGDFNTTAEEDARESMLDRFARPHWTVVHDKGCRDRSGECRGTSYYARDDSWSYLDMILWAPAQDRGAHATWHFRENSVRIANETAAQVREDGTPARFAMPEGSGVSDHWPLHFTIETK
ncbi:MAG TPA: endonuclease/exonuclease/phosphatase family protein [Burkholderiales bacterium]|nr:endonuclease/exonuclease/phosphatase family protein [Burkholderiales bacterium]